MLLIYLWHTVFVYDANMYDELSVGCSCLRDTVIKLSTHVLDHEHVFSLLGVEAKMNLFVGEHMFNINNGKENLQNTPLAITYVVHTRKALLRTMMPKTG